MFASLRGRRPFGPRVAVAARGPLRGPGSKGSEGSKGSAGCGDGCRRSFIGRLSAGSRQHMRNKKTKPLSIRSALFSLAILWYNNGSETAVYMISLLRERLPQ